jgi:hypothetical protein
MKRVFYYSGYRLTVFHWQSEKCIASFVFNPGEEGVEKFKTYLKATENTPVRILVDLIEEDFKKESIPHVGITDRKAIVSRLIDRQYRKSRGYVHYKVIEREKTGRRDDILLYSVLSNPEILEPWLQPIRDCNIAVSGIWSLPLLSEDLFRKIDNKSANILLVSQQVPSNLRQTYLKNGHFESSRSAVVNLDDASIGEYIATEVEQTIRFLSNQRHIGFDEKIEIHILCRQQDLTNIQSHCTDSALRTFHYHLLTDVCQSLGCNNLATTENMPEQHTEYSNGIYAYICANKLIPTGHYGNPSLFSRYYEQLLSRFLYSLSALLLIAASILSISYLSESAVLNNETATLRSQASGVNIDYDKTLSSLETRLDRTQLMKSSVLLHKKISSLKTLSPLNFMSDVSRILSRSGMYDTEITKLTWRQYQANKLPASGNSRSIKPVDYSKPDAVNQYAILAGYIRVSQSSLKDSVKKVNALVSAFKSNKLVKHVNIRRMPVDVRSKSSIENESGLEQRNDLSHDREKGQFELEIIMRSRDL